MSAQVALQLLVTKLFAPPTPRHALKRFRLLEKLSEVTQHPFTLVTAPAGYGKTSLVAAWLREAGMRSVWLSLDTGDNDEVRFWRYIVAALDRAYPDFYARFAAHLERPQFTSDDFLVALVNALNDVEALVFILDDYHLVENERIHAGMTFWLEHLPPHIHLVMISRSEPPLPLAKWRVKQRLLDLSAEALRFSEAEVATFLTEVMHLDLSRAEVDALNVYTEGWIASLHLAALSLQDAADTNSVLEALTNTRRFVFEYLADEVLNRQP